MSRIISCKVIPSTAIVPANSSAPQGAAFMGDCAGLTARRPVGRDLVNHRMQASTRIAGRPFSGSAREIPFGLVVDFLA